MKFSLLNQTNALAIVGGRGTGKTCLAMSVLKELSKKKSAYILSFPRPELLDKLGFKNLRSLEELVYLTDSVVLIDEPQLVIPRYDKRANAALVRLATIARHKNLTLIFATSDSRWFTRGVESYVDAWFVLDSDFDSLKIGSRVRSVIKANSVVDPRFRRIPLGRYLFWSRQESLVNECGEGVFGVPKWYSGGLSHAWR